MSEVYGDAISPNLQLKHGISIQDVVCNEDLVKLVHMTKDKIHCVKASSVDFFTKQGIWNIAPDTTPNVEEITDIVKTISIIYAQDLGDKKSTAAVYDYVFEVCAGSISLVTPELILKSDMQTKHVTLAYSIPNNSCQITTASINAIKSDSITIELTKQDDIMSKIWSLENEISEKTQLLEQEKKNLAQILAQKIDDKQQKTSESITKIDAFRQSINNLKDDLYRYHFVLQGMVSSKSVLLPKLSFAGSEISGNTVKIISIDTNIKTGPSYDVILELCAGQKSISNPKVELTSDTKKTVLELATVVANTCYITGAKVEAKSINSINAQFAETTSTLPIEEIIKNLNEKLVQKRTELIDIVNSANPDAKKIQQLTNEITALRDDLMRAKSQYYQTLNDVYK